MANKANKFYFENFIAAGECSCKAAKYLSDYMNNYKPEEIEMALSTIHGIEHMGDNKKHEMSAALAKAFVTPIDREDLVLISENIDDVTDIIEEILQRLYTDKIQTILPEAIIFSNKLVECCDLMTDMLRELENFKKPAKLHEMIVELNRVEEECDALYLKSLRNIFEHCNDTLEIIFWRGIYGSMEKCADACEHVGDCVAMVVMKNT